MRRHNDQDYTPWKPITKVLREGSYREGVQGMVREFHDKFNCAVDQREWAVIQSRLHLIYEETRELFEELAKEWGMDTYSVEGQTAKLPEDVDYEKAAKELADVVYVLYGTAEALGIDLDKAVRLVHASNMSKLWEDGKPRYRDSDGKVLKPPTYVVPDMSSTVKDL